MIVYGLYPFDQRVRRQAEALASSGGYNVVVLASKEETSPRKYSLYGVEVREMNVSKYQGKSTTRYLMSYFKFALYAFFACNRFLVNRSLDIVHIHNMPNFLVFCAITPFLLGKKVILDIHDIMLEMYLVKFNGKSKSLLGLVLRLEEFLSCSFAHEIICTNHVQRETLMKRGISGNKITILFNTPDPRIFNRTKAVEAKANDKKGFRIIYHGTVTKRLNLDLVIYAVASLVPRIPALNLTILGRGEDVQELKQLSKELGIRDVVDFRDAVAGERVVEILLGMDLGIVPNYKNISTELMLPVKMLECIALGIPVVVPRLEVIKCYFSDDMVSYFEPGDIDSLVSAILNAFNNESERIRKAEKAETFLAKYGWDTHKFVLIKLYQSFS